MMQIDHERLLPLLEIAIEQADKASARGDEPYGAVITNAKGFVIAADGNRENSLSDPTRHAEINAIGLTCARLGTKSLRGCLLVSNYHPCPMCAAAILMTGIEQVYTGSAFIGLDALFLHAADRVRVHGAACAQPGLANERCAKQVEDGRKQLHNADPGYRAGHLGGIL